MASCWCAAPALLAAALCALLPLPLAAASHGDGEAADNASACQPGLLLPVWMPQDNLSAGDRVARGLVYFFALLYLFIGVSIISDRFMAAIEVITSQEKEITVRKKSGETQILVVRVWNETVANLTLMALGSSAPEILLSIIEIYAKNFNAGDLGPGTIVGSAAYNLFVIIAICVCVIPDGEVRKIKHLRVFFVTATWSVFAYIWLYVILSVSSYGVVDVWEGLLTFMFFPATVITAYIADRRLLIYKYLHKGYRMNRRGVIVESEAGDVEMSKVNHVDGALRSLEEAAASEEVREFEQSRREYIQTLRDLRKRFPAMDLDQLELMAQEEVLNKGPKSRAFYRIQATRKMVGGGNIMRKIAERAQSDLSEVKAEIARRDDEAQAAAQAQQGARVYFEPGHYTVMENVGTFELRVVREGGDLAQQLLVDFATEDGTAVAGDDYVKASGTLVFQPGVTERTFTLQVIDDDVFEEDEHFYVRLSNVRVAEPTSKSPTAVPPPQLASPSLATVMILDDDHCGVFALAERDVEIIESVGTYELRVTRYSGARGRIAVPYSTEDGTAHAGKQYEAASGEIVFDNNETEKFIALHIIDEDSYEKDMLFYVQLGEPRMLGDEAGLAAEAELKKPEDLTPEEKVALLGRPKLGENTRTLIRIKESKEFKNTVDKLVQRANASLLIGTSSWKEQFIEAITVSPGDDGGGGEGDEDEEKLPSCGDYIMHFLTLFWKLLFAFVPPTDIYDGWVCFWTSISWIGVLTAVIGDVASHFGCTVTLPDTITAIAFVAMGTSLPDTFASKVAACQDKYADASVGNVTGSNAVNVFLGIGIAWSIAAIYHWSNGQQFNVNPGNMAFSVTIFCTEAAVAIMILVLRRSKMVGGELGGPKCIKWTTTCVLLSLWLIYLILSSLEVYNVIQGF